MRGMRWFLIIMVATVTVVASIGYYLIDNYENRYITKLNRDLAENNRQYLELVESEINNTIVLVESLGEALKFTKDIDSKELSSILNSIDEGRNIISNIYYTYDSDGSIVDYSGYVSIKELSFDLRERNWYLNAVKAKGLIITDAYSDFFSEKPVITIAYPVYADSKLQGVLSVDMFIEDIYRKLHYITQRGNTYSYVLDRQGTVVLHPDKEHLGLSYANSTKEQIDEQGMTREYYNNNLFKVWNDDYTKIDSGYVDYSNPNLIKVHAAFKHIPELGWTVVSAYEHSEIKNGILEYNLLVVFISLLVIIFFGVILYYFSVWSDSRDPITGTLTTGKMQELIKKRKGEERLIFLFIEPRNLSDINRRYGIKKGEEALLHFSQAIQYFVKKHGVLATTKNRNFIFVFNDNDWNTAVEFTTTLDKHLSKLLLSVTEQSFVIESFIGLTSYRLDEGRKFEEELDSAEELLMKYEMAGIESPLIGFDLSKLLEEKHKEILLKDELFKAIEEDRIIPFFQPIYDIKTGKTNKFEVLMRIKQGDKYLPPFQYIQIAELFNMIESVDFIVISKALEYKKNIDPDDEVELSMNISGLALHDYKFLNRIVRKVDELNIKHSNITFEITETQDALDSSETIDVITYFKNLGFKFSIDDFGTGFSSMYCLKHIPSNYVKIDGAFIKDLKINNESYYLVEAIISMAKAFKIKTIAEFVENQEINDILKQMGVDYGQGYYFGKPEECFNFHR